VWNKVRRIWFLGLISMFYIGIYTSYGYSDVPKEHWAYDVITSLSKESLLAGYPDFTFKPDYNMTRAEFITILIKVIEPNTDVSNVLGYWAEKSISIAKEKNILKTEEYSVWNPDENITRLEIFKMLVRALGIFEYKKISSDFNVFTDINQYSQEEKYILDILYRFDIVSGYPDGSCRLENLSTRAEVCAVISNFIKNMDKIKEYLEEDLVVYENDIAVIDKEKLPYKLKVWRGSNELYYVVTEIKDINCFEFNNAPNKYKDIFDGLYNSDDLYSKYRVKFGENNFVLVVDIETTNNTKNSEIFSGHEFLHITFLEEDISIIDSFDSDEIIRQKNRDASIGEKVMPDETKDTSVFYVINKMPYNKIRIDRNITELYDNVLDEIIKTSSFTSLIVRLNKEGMI